MKNEIKRMLQLKGMQQQDLAKSLGISKENLSQQLSRNNFRTNDLKKIADALGCEYISYFKEK